MDLGLKGKVIIVTGGSKGIGEGIVRAIAGEGGVPVIVGRSKEAGEGLLAELTEKSQEAYFIEAELADSATCKKAVEEVVERYGQLDGLVNNAGVNDSVGLESGSPEAFMDSLDRNLSHYYYMAHFALPHLKKSIGSILNISSKTALTGQGNTSGYAASKGAQLALTREWAAELLPYGIRVNAIVPAEVMTPLYKSWLGTFEDPEQKLQNITQRIPLGKRMTSKEEIAAMAVFLLSDKASHITGQHLFVDGGYVHLDRALN